MLTSEGVLAEGKITPKADVTMTLRLETTNILNYLEIRNYLQYLAWLPADFKTYDSQKYGYVTNEKMKSVFGFEAAYEAISPESQYFYASLDRQKPFSISGYSVPVLTPELITISLFCSARLWLKAVKLNKRIA
jgi:hypothetical protein